MRNTILITAACLAALSAMPASAQVQASRTVSFADLDLGTHGGRARLDRRIAVADEAVCGSYAGASDAEQHEIARCRTAAGNGIRSQLAALQPRNARLALGSR